MKENEKQEDIKNTSIGYGLGPVDTVITVEEVERQAAKLAADGPNREYLGKLVGQEPLLFIGGLRAGYGKMVVLHDFNLQIGAGQSLCLIGPNGAGKSTILHSIYGFTTITGGTIKIRNNDITRLSPNEKLKQADIGYVLVSGRLAMAGSGDELLQNPEVGRLFLGG